MSSSSSFIHGLALSLSATSASTPPKAHLRLLRSNPPRLVSARQPTTQVACFRIRPFPTGIASDQLGSPAIKHTASLRRAKVSAASNVWFLSRRGKLLRNMFRSDSSSTCPASASRRQRFVLLVSIRRLGRTLPRRLHVSNLHLQAACLACCKHLLGHLPELTQP
jgi:hypothetical protein